MLHSIGSQTVDTTEQKLDLNSIKTILLRNHSIWTRNLACHQYLYKYESNQSILKEISPEYSSEGLMLKLKLQYFGHLMQRMDSLEKTLMLGKTEGRRRRGRQRMRWLDGISNLMDMSLSELRKMMKGRETG